MWVQGSRLGQGQTGRLEILKVLKGAQPLTIPSWELTYPLPQGMFKDDFPFPRVGYVIVPKRESRISYSEHVPFLFNLQGKLRKIQVS